MWEPDLRAMLPETTAAHRQWLETRPGSPLSDRSWSLAVTHQGEGLGEDAMADPQFASLILLLVLPPEVVGSDAVSSGVETCWQNIREHAPPALLPFADDTDGNLWAFDGRPAQESRHRLRRPRARR
ncbi:hypothetical protein EBE87_27070 [Pseudoroseomonas wenyumeiae]|uniref:Uncharacterized protein n=1 Tax=Teichococcus wenyumeiae TaxID=2478470 RepID=A0A3A9J447_9PROT|nr:SMI1/KNR4 family protein [Pseudoroseomonas wenyumeiae]RKK01977.1 hypothetical protein D6Z83_22155 [Pseudoroseomonas wenyumeiae]RMI15148.1 hypothetical protein EBE87_27070 [Pseudoroseomonas wenyumeiae]